MRLGALGLGKGIRTIRKHNGSNCCRPILNAQNQDLYQHWGVDSLRWNFLTFRDDDIVIATSGKTGTTWTHGIVANLIFPGCDLPGPPLEMSPWLDIRIPARIRSDSTRGGNPSALYQDALAIGWLRFDQRVKYLYVGCDTRDVFMSWWNHYRSFTEDALISFHSAPGRVGPEIARCLDDIHDYWRTFMTRGWFG